MKFHFFLNSKKKIRKNVFQKNNKKNFTKIKLIKIKFVTEGRTEGRKDGTTDRGHFIGPFPSLLGGPKMILKLLIFIPHFCLK